MAKKSKGPAPKAPKAARTKAGVPGTKAAETPSNVVTLPTKTRASSRAPGTNQLTPDQKRALALRHAEKLKDHKAKVARASGELRAFLKEAKSDGFLKRQLEAIILAQTPEGEAKLREDLALTLEAAKWAGRPFGDLLDHLEAPDLTPAVDRARDEGKMASMENRPARPDYHASTPQYAAYMEGYHEHQATLAAGIKPLALGAQDLPEGALDDDHTQGEPDPEATIPGEEAAFS